MLLCCWNLKYVQTISKIEKIKIKSYIKQKNIWSWSLTVRRGILYTINMLIEKYSIYIFVI